MVPLAWIFLTSIKSPPDSISYPPKILFQPTVEGYCNLFAAQSRQTADYMAKLLPSLRQLADHRLWIHVPRRCVRDVGSVRFLGRLPYLPALCSRWSEILFRRRRCSKAGP